LENEISSKGKKSFLKNEILIKSLLNLEENPESKEMFLLIKFFLPFFLNQ